MQPDENRVPIGPIRDTNSSSDDCFEVWYALRQLREGLLSFARCVLIISDFDLESEE